MKFKLIGILIAVVWGLLQWQLARFESPTFDEPVHVKAGWEYLLGNFEFDPIEPPLWRVLVVLPTRLGVIGQNDLNYINYRVVTIAVGLVLVGLLVNLIASTAGVRAATLVGLLILVEPNWLTHGHYVTTDFVSSVMVLLTIGYWRYFPNHKMGWILPGVAMAIKVSAGIYLAIAWLLIYRKKFWVMAMVAGTIIWASYGFRFQPILADSYAHNSIGQYPKVVQQIGKIKLPMGGYFQAVKENFLFGSRGLSVYFAGEIYEAAPWWKQISVLWLKVPWPIWVLFLMGLILGKIDRRLFLVMLGWIALNMVGKLHLGIRHELVISGLLIISMKDMAKYWWSFGLVLIAAFLVIGNGANTMTFSNSIRPIYWHSDADFDWGQGLFDLKKEIDERHLDQIQFAYFGNVNPALWGIDYERIMDANPVETKPIKAINFDKPIVISVTCWQTCGYEKDERFRNREMEMIGGSFLLIK